MKHTSILDFGFVVTFLLSFGFFQHNFYKIGAKDKWEENHCVPFRPLEASASAYLRLENSNKFGHFAAREFSRSGQESAVLLVRIQGRN